MFKNFIESSLDSTAAKKHLCYASTVINYSRSEANITLYTNRIHILRIIFPPVDNAIDCMSNINGLYTTLMKEYTSTLEIKTCTDCDYKEENKKPVIPIPNTKIVWENQYKNLELEVTKYFQSKSIFCKKCKKETGLLTYNVGPYIWIDTEDAYKFFSDLNKDADKITTNIADLPTKIKIQENIFVLCGVVKYIHAEFGSSHYVALCRRLNGFWEKKK